MAAPLGGGIRYNGPADTLYSFFGPATQHVSGPIAVAADFSCSVADPCLQGVVRGKDMVYENQTYGTRLTNMVVNGRFTGNRLEIEATDREGRRRHGPGEGLYQPCLGRRLSDEYFGDARQCAARQERKYRGARDGQSDARKGRGAGRVAVGQPAPPRNALSHHARGRGAGSGADRRAPQARPQGRQRISGDGLAAVGGSLFDLIRLDIALKAPDEIYVTGMGLESEWKADVVLRGTTKAPRVTGEIELVRGTLGFAGRSFELQEGG
jgi:translocation and assembly module TamB